MSDKEEKTVLEKAATVDEPTAEKAEAKVQKTEKTGKAKKKAKKERKHPFKEMFSELKKVSWPTGSDLRTYTTSVVVFVVVFAVILAVMDYGVSWFTKFITNENMLPGILNGWFHIGG